MGSRPLNYSEKTGPKYGGVYAQTGLSAAEVLEAVKKIRYRLIEKLPPGSPGKFKLMISVEEL